MKPHDDFPDYHSYMETRIELERRQFRFVVKVLVAFAIGIGGMAYHFLTQ